MNTRQEMLSRFFKHVPDPSKLRLVRISGPFPNELNPFAGDGVVIRAAGVPGEAQHSKWVIAREGILQGIRSKLIGPLTTVIEATSGNTGEAMAKICNAIGIRFVAVMSSDVPNDKIDAIRVIGRRTGLHILTDTEETTVQYARRLGGTEKDWYNPDQYFRDWNWKAHLTYLAPQLWHQQPDISLLFVPSGTMGTSIGLSEYAVIRTHTKVVPVLCAEDEEVPGARTLTSVMRDVWQPWESSFRLGELEFGTRHAAFYLSFLTWPYVMPNLGPSFGLGFAGALRFLQKHKEAGTLDRLGRDSRGMIQVVVFGPDDCRPYLPLYFSELKKWELSSRIPPKDLLSVLDQ